MKISYQFKSLDWSESLVQYTEEKLQRLVKFEMKPVHIHVTYSAERHNKTVEMHIVGGTRSIAARGEGESFQAVVDQVALKLQRQMSKHKQKKKNHHSPEYTRGHRAKKLQEQIEMQMQLEIEQEFNLDSKKAS